jgi:hypothetical protein
MFLLLFIGRTFELLQFYFAFLPFFMVVTMIPELHQSTVLDAFDPVEVGLIVFFEGIANDSDGRFDLLLLEKFHRADPAGRVLGQIIQFQDNRDGRLGGFGGSLTGRGWRFRGELPGTEAAAQSENEEESGNAGPGWKGHGKVCYISAKISGLVFEGDGPFGEGTTGNFIWYRMGLKAKNGEHN